MQELDIKQNKITFLHFYLFFKIYRMSGVMVFYVEVKIFFMYILVEETGVPRENHQFSASDNLSKNSVCRWKDLKLCVEKCHDP